MVTTNPRIRIKICGVDTPEIARIAVAAGADAVGLVFHPPSARNLEFAQAAAICNALPPYITAVAVLVNPPAEFIRALRATAAITLLQFHGEETPEFCAAHGLPYMKTLRVQGALSPAQLQSFAARYAGAQGILLDSKVDGMYGGSGEVFAWRRADGGEMPIILAGGLTAENVQEGIGQVAPYGVDVSSGVETAGRKDAAKIRAFCAAARAAIS